MNLRKRMGLKSSATATALRSLRPKSQLQKNLETQSTLRELMDCFSPCSRSLKLVPLEYMPTFRDWTNWLLYRGGIGVKGEESWEAWWDEELSHIRTFEGRILETILSLRFFIFQYGIVYKLNIQRDDTSLTVYGLSWAELAGLIVLFKVFTFSQKISVNFQLLLRFIQSISLLAIAGLVIAVVFTKLSVPDIFASVFAFIPTGWGILFIASAWKPVIKKLGLWKSICSIARLYDAGMGMVIFIPIAFFSWFPFVSMFQTRLMFNQAFSRGLEISLILAGNNDNTGVTISVYENLRLLISLS